MRALTLVVACLGCASAVPHPAQPWAPAELALVLPAELTTRADSAALLRFALVHALDSMHAVDSTADDPPQLWVPDLLRHDTLWLRDLVAHERVRGLCGEVHLSCRSNSAVVPRIVELPELRSSRAVALELQFQRVRRPRRTVRPHDEQERFVRRLEVGILPGPKVMYHGVLVPLMPPRLSLRWLPSRRAWVVTEWKAERPWRGGGA
jgi:hypothetical protein